MVSYDALLETGLKFIPKEEMEALGTEKGLETARKEDQN